MRMIYSDSLNEMIIKGFTYKSKHYTWNDLDCVYYCDNVDDTYFFEVPINAKIDQPVYSFNNAYNKLDYRHD